MADFGQAARRKAIITMYERTRKITLFVYQGAFRRVNDKLWLAQDPDINLEFCQFTETSAGRSRRVTSKHYISR